MHDFYSDTKSKPTDAMRQAVLTAVVGDEQKDEDPTTARLCERVADLLGKERAVFLPSGTLANEIALQVHVRPGEEVICERSSHIVRFEGGAPAVYAGAMIQALDGERGMLAPDQIRRAVHPGSRYTPKSRLLCVEQTANMAGGAVWPVERLDAVAEVAREADLATHMDGARLMNAVVQSGVPASRMAAGYDSVWIDFTKGLGAPVGAALAGSAAFIDAAWRIKQRMGGAMRQSGILAAMCEHALDHHVERLAEDHALARRIAEHVMGLSKVARLMTVDTNIVIFDLTDDAPTAAALVETLAEEGIAIGAFGERRIRIVTHLDVGRPSADALRAALTRHLD